MNPDWLEWGEVTKWKKQCRLAALYLFSPKPWNRVEGLIEYQILYQSAALLGRLEPAHYGYSSNVDLFPVKFSMSNSIHSQIWSDFLAARQLRRARIMMHGPEW